MSQRVDFLTPRASLPPQSPPGLAGFEGRWPHSGSSTGPHGWSSRCGCGRDRCPPARRHPLGAISHWRGPFHFVSCTGRCVGSQEAPWLRRLSRPARRWCREQGEQGAVRPGGAREAGCSRTTPAAAAPSHVCGCCGDETSVRPKPRLQARSSRRWCGTARLRVSAPEGLRGPARRAGGRPGVPALSLLSPGLRCSLCLERLPLDRPAAPSSSSSRLLQTPRLVSLGAPRASCD